VITVNNSTTYAICNPLPQGLQCGLVAVRPQTKSPVQIGVDGEIKHISLPPNLNNQPLVTFAKDIFLPYA
jgi:hypothetical protein